MRIAHSCRICHALARAVCGVNAAILARAVCGVNAAILTSGLGRLIAGD
jgi:hypothetical protein